MTAGGQDWQPSEQAMDWAKKRIHYTDIPMHVARYVLVKMEQKLPPQNTEWLKWLVEDEKKAKAQAQRETAAANRKRSWHEVAD